LGFRHLAGRPPGVDLSQEGVANVNFSRNAALWIFIVLLVLLLFNLFQGTATRGPAQPMAFSDFIGEVQDSQVREVTIQGEQITGHFNDGRQFQTYAPDDPNLVSMLLENGVRITAAPEENGNPLRCSC
jgi:cell division protease FtsH